MIVTGAVAAAVALLVGVIVLRRSGQRTIGWLLVAHACSVVLLLATPGGPARSRPWMVIQQLSMGAWTFLFFFIVLIAYLLPTGRPQSRFWRAWIVVGLAAEALFLVGAAGDREGFAKDHNGAALPVPWLPDPVSGFAGILGLMGVVAFFFGSVVSVRSRLKVAGDDERLQLLWLVWGSLSVPAALLVLWAVHFTVGDRNWFTSASLGLAGVAMPTAIGIAILRHHLFDVRVVVSRTLIYGALVAGILAVYGAALLATERLVGDGRGGALFAVGIVAVAIHPAYASLRGWVERWVYGYRSEPNAALTRLAATVAAADSDKLVTAVTDAVARVLKVERAWIEPESEPEGSESAEVAGGPELLVTPLAHRGEHVGRLVVERPAGRTFSPSDVALLRNLGEYAAAIVRAEQLTDELRDSRSRIVASREEERRRLRRDLHDGVGPSLAAIVLKLNAAQSRADDAERNALIAETRDEVRAAIAEVRRLVDDLRPPAIDEVGLLGALRHRAAALSGDVAFEVAAPREVPLLPAAVEVAAFRIASEAMTNVVRHSGASRCHVEVVIGEELEITIADNGRGADGSTTDGVGWASMNERAAELGGTCTLAPLADGGLLVRATLPLGKAEPVEVPS